MDDAAFQSSVVLKDAQLKAIFAEYYYDCTNVTTKTSARGTKTTLPKDEDKATINTADIRINGV